MGGRVSFVDVVLTRYRLPFHETVREKLAAENINYQLIYSDPIGSERLREDTTDLPWATKIKKYQFSVGPGDLCWQSAVGAVAGSDLVIIVQQNILLFNYLAHLARALGVYKLAYFGHGRNFQASETTAAARFKSFWATKVDWWFAYTEETRRIVEGYGFSSDRITVFNNAVDTRQLTALTDSLTEQDLQRRRAELNLMGCHVGVYVGGMYREKRLPFVLAAALRIRECIPDFELLFIGAGNDATLVKAAASRHDWIHYLGPLFGKQKAEVMKLAQVFLMPGLVGLAVLDSFAAGLPLITTSYPFHSPEIAYLRDDTNGVIVKSWEDPGAYAEGVIAILLDDAKRKHLSAAARADAERYTIDAMAERFVAGVIDALAR